MVYKFPLTAWVLIHTCIAIGRSIPLSRFTLPVRDPERDRVIVTRDKLQTAESTTHRNSHRPNITHSRPSTSTYAEVDAEADFQVALPSYRKSIYHVFADDCHDSITQSNVDSITQSNVRSEVHQSAKVGPALVSTAFALSLAFGRIGCEATSWVYMKSSDGFNNQKCIFLAATFHAVSILAERQFLILYTLGTSWGMFTVMEFVTMIGWGVVAEGERLTLFAAFAVLLGMIGVIVLDWNSSGHDHSFHMEFHDIVLVEVFAMASFVFFPLLWALNSSRAILSRKSLAYLGLIFSPCFEVLTCIMLVNGETFAAVICGIGFTGAGVVLMADNGKISWAYTLVSSLEYIAVEFLSIYLFGEQLNLKGKLALIAILSSSTMLAGNGDGGESIEEQDVDSGESIEEQPAASADERDET